MLMLPDQERSFRSTNSADGTYRLARYEAPAGFPAPGFWPPGDRYNVALIDLHIAPLRELLPDHWLELVRLVSIADAVGVIQHPEGSALSEALMDELMAKSGAILDEVASAVPDEAIADLLKLRAKELASRQFGAGAVRQAEIDSDDLVVLCGPLTSWRSKSRQLLHAAVVGLDDKEHTEKLAQLDKTYDQIVHFFEDTSGIKGLSLSPVPGFTICDLVLCGGEANKYPKHFSYFLPEDEGVKGAAIKKTVVFKNIYLERFRLVSLPLLELYSGKVGDDVQSKLTDPMWLLSWFKGHDTGHSVRMETTDFRALRQFGFDASIVLQEALADVLGYLAMAGPWSPALPADAYAAGVTVLAELLRYLRRGQNFFPDSGAAFLELSFLGQKGFVDLDPERGVIDWDPFRLFEGMSFLAQNLLRAVLMPDVALVADLLQNYSHWSDGGFGERVAALLPAASTIPHDVGYKVVD